MRAGRGQPVTDQHHELPIGSAGVLIGETTERHPVFLPFDDVDNRIIVGDGLVFSQFMVRSAAAGAVVTVDARLREFGSMVNARFGEPRLTWPGATTYFAPHHRVGQVTLHRNYIATPRHGKLPIRLVQPGRKPLRRCPQTLSPIGRTSNDQPAELHT